MPLTIIEEELLVEKVKEYPALFDKTAESYKEKKYFIECLCGFFRRAASYVGHFIFLSDKIILNQEVISVILSNVISTLIILIM